jgi:zinc transport system substrate-binding protein
MKRILLALLLAALLPMAFLGGAGAQEVASSQKLNVVATIFPPYDFVRQIAGDRVELTMLLPPGAESHSFEPTPQDIIKIQNCDVFLYVGGESDTWMDRILDSMDTSNIRIISLMDLVETVEEEIVEGMEEDEHEHQEADHEEEEHKEGDASEDYDHDHEEEEAPEYDEHVWTSPENAKQIVQGISQALCEADAANANAYQSNTAAYLAKLDALDAAFQEVVKSAARKTIVFGDRFPFRYFADAYGLTYFAAFPGCSTETEASAATVKFLIDKIKAEKIPVVFHIELSNEKMTDAIAEETGARALLLHSCHNISRDDFAEGLGYLELMTRNVEALKEALQ